MKKSGRYDVSGFTETQFEPGSNGLVLKNRLGIKSAQEMDVAEARALERAMSEFIGSYGERHRFTAADLSAENRVKSCINIFPRRHERSPRPGCGR